MSSLVIQDLHVAIGEKEIVKGLSLTIQSGEVHAIMGPNGTGKSTLAKVIAGHPDYTITSGDVLLDGKSILEFEADERARAGLFLAFQYPSEIPGVSIANFLRAAAVFRFIVDNFTNAPSMDLAPQVLDAFRFYLQGQHVVDAVAGPIRDLLAANEERAGLYRDQENQQRQQP